MKFLSVLIVFLFSIILFSMNVNADFRIVGGENALHSEMSFIVSLQKDGKQFCGGSLIASNWILTAAHCMSSSSKPNKVVIGADNLNNTSEAEVFNISYYVVHSEFTLKTLRSDFALIRINGRSKFEPIQMNTSGVKDMQDSMLTTAGWGATFEGSDASDDLQKVKLPYVNFDLCEERLQEYRPYKETYLDETMFCAGYMEGGKDSCQGDSGGPIFYHDSSRNRDILVGVVSWGLGCGRKNLAGVYADVSTAVDWVDEQIAVYEALGGL